MRGKSAIITGGGQGIGKAIARRFLEAGMRVAVADLDREAGSETAAEYGKLGEIVFLPADVSKEEDVAGMVADAAGSFGGIDVLVNNAGIFVDTHILVENLSLGDWNRVLATNLTSVFLCTKHAAPSLRERCGAVINIASTRALMSEGNTEAYSASKGGIVALTHALAVSLGPAVRVNCISPGWIETGPWKKRSLRHEPELSERDHRQHPSGRVGRPEDVAALALFLASEDQGFITGANYIIDGGMTRKMIYV